MTTQEQITQADALISDRELSKILGRARSTIQKDRHFGRGLPFVRQGGAVRYRLSDVQAHVESLQRFKRTSEYEVLKNERDQA